MQRPELAISQNSEHLIKIANLLDEIQKTENNGRGVSCVKSAIDYLKSGDFESAKQICRHDHDKIINYPRLVEFIKKNLFNNKEDHPWSVLECLQKKIEIKTKGAVWDKIQLFIIFSSPKSKKPRSARFKNYCILSNLLLAKTGQFI
jgi:hypothetical protein